MAVTIQLDVDAAGATGSIGAVAASLKGLERIADDIDIDFDADIGNITDELEAFSDALDDIDLDVDKVGRDLRQAAKELNDAEVTVISDEPDGRTGSGDSTGGDPQRVTVQHDLRDIVQDTQESVTSDGGRRANLFERIYGEHTLMGKQDDTKFPGSAGQLHTLGSNRRASNFGSFDEAFRSSITKRLGTRTGFGLDPESMTFRRMADSIPMEEFQNAGDTDRSGGAPRFEDLIRDFRQITLQEKDLIQEQERLFKKASAPIDTPFRDRGLNFDARMSQLTSGLLNEIRDDPSGGPDLFDRSDEDTSVTFDSPLISDSMENLEEQKRELLRDAGLDPDKVGDTSGPKSIDLTNFNDDKGRVDEFGFRPKDKGEFDEFGFRSKDKGEPGDLTSGPKSFDFTDFNEEIRKGKYDPELGERVDKVPETDSEIERATAFSQNLFERDGKDKDFGKTFKEFKEDFGGFGSKLRKLKPTMGKYMQLLAALIPIAVALGTQLLGVAAAMGAVAAAGGAVIGLGLLGHAESLSGSVAQAKAELRELKFALFETFQPSMQQFAPIQSRAFDAIPGALEPVAEEMEGLASFEDTLFELGGALAGGMEETIEIINENEAAIKQLTTRFAGLIGSGILDFFEWLIQAAHKNQDLIVKLGSALIQLAVVAYNVSMAISRFITTLRPVIDLLVWLSGLLNNRLVLGFLTFLGVTYLTIAAVTKLALATGGLLAKLGILGSGSFIGTVLAGLGSLHAQVSALIGQYTALSGAAARAAAAIAMTGVGLLAVGAGTIAAGAIMSNHPGSGVGPGRSGYNQNVYNDNRSFTVNHNGDDGDYASQKAIEDVVKRVDQKKSSQQLPPLPDS